MEYLNRTFAIVEAFSGYPNTLMFFSGNEVINDLDSAEFVPPYLRAITRDLKNYIKNNIKRKIPVGYSAADVREVLWDTWNYMQCAEDGEKDDMSRADVFALNSYSWCGADATYKSSSYDVLTSGFKDSSVPVFFSEYGCNTPTTRYWKETQAMYGKDMTPVFSGGVVYEWTEEDNKYGLVKIDGEELSVLGDYNRLKEQFAKIEWKTVQSKKASKKALTPPKCVSKLIQEKGFNNNFTLPVVPPKTQTLIDNGIKSKPSGKLVKISDWNVKLTVKDSEGKVMKGLKVVPLEDDEFNWPGKNDAQTGTTKDKSSDDDASDKKDDGKDGDDKDKDEGNAAMTLQPAYWVLLPLVAIFLV